MKNPLEGKMLLKNRHWDMIKDRLSETDVEEILGHIVAKSLSPVGVILDILNMKPDVLSRLNTLLGIKHTSPGVPPVTPGNTLG